MTSSNHRGHDSMRVLIQLLTICSICHQGAESFANAPSALSTTMAVLRTPCSSPSDCQSYDSSRLFYSRLTPHLPDLPPQKEPEELRREIEAMRQEALQKLQVLQERIQEVEVKQEPKVTAVVMDDNDESDSNLSIPSVVDALDSTSTSPSNIPQSGEEVFLDFMEREKAALEETNDHVGGPVSSTSKDDADTTTIATVESEKEDDNTLLQNVYPLEESLRRLDDTRWRMMLNLGREPGTWMPTEWGASGERLYLQLELEFSSEALLQEGGDKFKNKNFPGDDFLNGRSNTKMLKVVHNEANLSPTLKEGARKVRVQNGAWRVAPYEGPLGTTVLRFYVEVEEQTSHQDSDVWCPAGRVYCTCGYFPMNHDPETGVVSTCSQPLSSISHNGSSSPASLKDALKEEQGHIAALYDALARANHEDPAMLSWNKLKRSSKMLKLKQQATKLAQKRYELNIQEPDKSVLRLSQDQQVGLTKEGGVCCKVHKGLAVEYHMLGKFEIASMKNRDHKDYRELLP